MTTENSIISTSTGKVSGFWQTQQKYACFFGIPYAEPPIGNLRFKPTVPKAPWQGIFNATHFSECSPQIFDPCEGNYEEFTDSSEKKPWVGSENSLTLNIWTPSPDNRKRPVMVWIHGGANWLESSRLATYHGDAFVERGDVVFVSFNYRLGIFGFLDVSILGGEPYKGSHSNGLRDQVTALKWIKENIANFGGDPNNITVMGESAGSIDISWLLTSGHLNEIAKRVVMMSGVAGLQGLSGNLRTGFTEEFSQQKARKFLSQINIRSMQELLDLSTDEIMERVTNVAKNSDMLFDMDSLFWACVTPDFAPLDPFRAVRKSGNHGIDVMIGYTAYEMGLWLFWDDTLDQQPCSWAAEKILDFDPSQQAEVVKLYSQDLSSQPTGTYGMHLLGDSIFVIPSFWFADEITKHGGKVWMYQFDRKTDERRKALHAADQSYLFDKRHAPVGQKLLGAPDAAREHDRQRLTHAMQDTVLAFARSGDPNAHNNPNLPHWNQYDKKNRAQMSLDFECKIINDPIKTRREWWYKHVYTPSLLT